MSVRRAARCCAVATLAWLGWAQANGPLPDLPAPVASAVARAVESAARDPTVRLGEARHAATAASVASPRPSWSFAADVRHDAMAGASLDANASLSLALLEPGAIRDRAELRSQTESLQLERSLLRRDAALATLATWLSAWAARERLALLELVPDAVARDAGEERRRQGWLSQHPAIEHEARLWWDRLAVDGPLGEDLPAGDDWRRWAMQEAPFGCPERAPEVLLARAELARVDRSLRAAQAAASHPSLSAGASAQLSTAFVPPSGTGTAGAPTPPQLGVRLWLNLGAPASWSNAASLRLSADADGASLGLRVGSEAPAGSARFALEREVARARLDRALRDAFERTAFEAASLATMQARLAAGPIPIPTREVRFAQVEVALEELEVLARAVEARARLLVDCEPGGP